MAKIEMDLSEYEAIMKNKQLLEDTLKNERSLQEEIKKLTNEKTKALEDAKMKVVKVTKTEHTEHLLVKRTNEDYVLQQLLHALGVDYRYVRQSANLISVERLQDIFFDKVDSISFPKTETTTHGLDDIKLEIRTELKQAIDSDIKYKLTLAEDTLEKNNKLISENKKLSKENENLINTNKAIVENLEQNIKSLTNYTINAEKFLTIKDILKNGYGFNGKAKLLDSIIAVVIKQ
jgi:hypothetical protein